MGYSLKNITLWVDKSIFVANRDLFRYLASPASLTLSMSAVRISGPVISPVIIMQSSVVCLLVLVAAVAAAPQREGAAFSKEAIKQAQNTFLIPKDAEIQKVSS